MTGVMKAIMLAVSLMLEVSEGANASATATCKDVAASDDGVDATCYENALWAQANGSQVHPEWYTNYKVTNTSSVTAWQCVLYHKSLNKDDNDGKESHNCTKPCNFNSDCTLKATPAPAPAPAAVAVADTTTVKKSDGGMPGWAWALIVVGVCCGLPCLGLMCSAFLCYEAVAFIVDPIFGKKDAPKKKRAVKKAVEPAAPAAAAPVATLAPVYTTSVPMPVYQAAPMVTYAAPQILQAQPVYATQAASVSYAAPTASVSYAAPAMTYAAPAASVSYAASAMPYTGDVITHHVDGHTSQHHMQ